MSTTLESRSALTSPLRVSRPLAGVLSLVALPFALGGVLMVIGALVATVRALSGSDGRLMHAVVALVVATPRAAVALTAFWRMGWQAVTGRETALISWWVALPTLLGVALPSGTLAVLMQFVHLSARTRVGLFLGLCIATATVTLLFVRRLRTRMSAS